jgi:hypothetical protein
MTVQRSTAVSNSMCIATSIRTTQAPAAIVGGVLHSITARVKHYRHYAASTVDDTHC